MFNIFKQDISIGDKIKLYLTTGKEPKGTVIEIGDNFVLLKSDDNTQNRFFDKLIGGWDVIAKETIISHDSIKRIIQVENDKNEQIVSINKERALNVIEELLNSNLNLDFETLIEPNANIVEVNKLACHAADKAFSDIIIRRSIIFDKKLLTEIESFSRNSIIPVVIQYYKNKKDKIIVTNAFAPNTLKSYFILLKDSILNDNYIAAEYILTFIMFKLQGKCRQQIKIIKKEFNKIKQINLEKRLIKIDQQSTENKEEKNTFKHIEREITNLLKNSEFESALKRIKEELINTQLDEKYKSSLLLKKAQVYSSLNNPSESEQSYQELIAFNEKIGSPANNLSHLYTELARLQALDTEKQDLALESVKKALKYNPNNNFANNLLSQIQGKSPSSKVDKIENDENNLLVDAEDDSTVISKMIDIDIREHKFTDLNILKNAGKPTAFIAKQVFEIAKETRDIDLSERYPLYLEAAKAFSELNIGSYDLQDYLESVAYYAMLKGNSLYINFRNNIQNEKIEIKELTRLKDSACSYYSESLNLLSSIEPKHLLTILSNYLELNIALYKLNKNEVVDFKGQFSEVFFNCIRSKDNKLEKIAYQTVVGIGAASPQAWNKLADITGGTAQLYGEFGSNKKHIFNIINEIEKCSIDINLNPSKFLKESFQQRKRKEREFGDVIFSIREMELEPHNVNAIIEKWEKIEKYWILLSITDIETKEKIDEILSILKPFLYRNQSERTNILIVVQKMVDEQIKFINKNTTFYGRTLFFPLLNKWKREIGILLEEKIAQSYPSLEVVIDPPYFVETDGEKIINIIIKNNGEATTEGFELEIISESTEDEDIQQHFSSLTEKEIPAGEQVDANFIVPIELLKSCKAIEIKVKATAIYQKKKIDANIFQFTIEEEPEAKDILTYDDIVWKDGPIPEKHLFIGRQQIISNLAQHYESVEKDKPYILYGLTRTGKSSILKYLKENLQGDIFTMKAKEMILLPFSWDLSEAASFKKASDFWEYILSQQIIEKLDSFIKLYNLNLSDLSFPQTPRAKDFPYLLNYFHSKNIYPLFLIDEFSFIKTLIDGGIVNAAFLHTLRQHSLNGLASFIYAGTYDIKQLISDPKYGITGQLVNAIEEQINEISDKDATTLIEAMKNKLIFTTEAISHIQTLSGNIPYFIQIICKYCGYYASEKNRLHIGYPELERVTRILTGQDAANSNSLVKKLPENIFQNNQFSPADPKEVNVLISSIVHFNRDKINNPRGVGFDELQRLWAEKGVIAFRPKLADAINLLKDKKILIQEEDEGIPVYKFAVDLFRRWWTVHHSDIDLEITTII